MDKFIAISMADWQGVLLRLTDSYSLFAPVAYNGTIDYELISKNNSSEIIYNHPKPSTPVKTFFIPVKENVTVDIDKKTAKIIMGVPACDLSALSILDEMYLGRDYEDLYYKEKRENYILIGSDCHSAEDSCHCTSCGINPYPEGKSDITLVKINDKILLKAITDKGGIILEEMTGRNSFSEGSKDEIKQVLEKRTALKELLLEKNRSLPDYKDCINLVSESNDEIWETYSSTCVSCGACAAICPTCTCFLLTDRPGFEKIRQLDACQYPGFESVAAGEDPLEKLSVRFKNRYMCKYVWKPEGFSSLTCTGCGRCIDACIGSIDKNEILEKLASETEYEGTEHIQTPQG